MTVRVVLAVLFALAIVAAAQPAVEHARDRRGAESLRATADRTADAITSLHRRSDPGSSLVTAPRRTIDLDLPDGATLAVVTDPPRLEYRLANRPTHSRPLPLPVVACGDTDELAGEVTLAYVEGDEGPVVVATRGFIPGNGTSASHACALPALRE